MPQLPDLRIVRSQRTCQHQRRAQQSRLALPHDEIYLVGEIDGDRPAWAEPS